MDSTAGWLLAAQLANLAGGLLVGVALSHALGAGGQGLVQVTVLVPQALALAGAIGGSATLTYFRSQGRSRPAVLGWLYVLAAAVAVLAWALIAGVPGLFAAARAAGMAPGVLQAGALAAGAQTLANGVSAVAIAEQRASAVMVVTTVPRLIVMLGLATGWLVHQLTPAQVVPLYWLAAGLSALAGLVVLGPPRAPAWNPDLWRAAAGYGLRGHWGNVAQLLNYRVGLWLLGLTGATARAGWYWLALTLSELLWYVPQAAAGAWLPRVGQGRVGSRDTVALARTLGWLSMALALTGGALAWGLLPVIWGRGFRPALGPLWELLPGTALFAWAKILASDLAGRNRPEWGTAASLTGAASLVLTGWMGLAACGIGGLAAAQSFSYAVTTAVLAVGFRRVHPDVTWLDMMRFSPREWLRFVGRWPTGGTLP
ncbi:MAG: hypothetical protein M0Z53_02500 [Thermaerobacter sp.]|nr:hypothetical protein [Thermaerobacter sp.]